MIGAGRAGRLARGAWESVGAVVFPATCWATNAAIEVDDHGLSPPAREAIARAQLWPYCMRCGLTIGAYSDRAGPCGRCGDRDVGVQGVVRVGTYEPPLSTLIHVLKFNRRWEVARVLAPYLAGAMQMATDDGSSLPVDVLVPVPLHWRRKLTRGFNQSAELAREVSRLTRWPVADALRRVKPTLEQSHTLSATQRKENLKGAFAALEDRRIAGRHVWLIDDVSTTGATIHAAATALRKLPKESRPAGIHAAVICVTDKVSVPTAPASTPQ